MTSKIKITPASIEQQSVIAQLYELYTYEMTDLADFDINVSGYYGYSDLLGIPANVITDYRLV